MSDAAKANIDLDDRTVPLRERLLAAAHRALRAGALVLIGDDVLALREQGQPIDDGVNPAVMARAGGLFCLLHVYQRRDGRDEWYHRWVRVFDDASAPEPYLRAAIDGLDDAAAERLRIAIRFVEIMSPLPIRRAIAHGLWFADMPASIIGAPPLPTGARRANADRS